tara:strand:+ start:7518 stop:8564 length:1047 start_codon:yes stop_codon:yes gene_type:complete
MIAKEKVVSAAQDKRTQAGNKQESDVAFYLRRAYGDREDVIVLNDLRVSHNGEVAQIDHFIIFAYGFIIVESKSIHGHVKVNKHGEWTRSYKSRWYGIPSPLRQADLQAKLVKGLLNHHAEEVLPAVNLVAFKITQRFGGRVWKKLCAVSNNCILERDNISRADNKLIYKAESLINGVDGIIGKQTSFSTLATINRIVDSRPVFSKAELHSIKDFLLSQHTEARNVLSSTKGASLNISATGSAPKITQPTIVEGHTDGTPDANEATKEDTSDSALLICCKYCKAEEGLNPKSGKYGYYVTCGECAKNTPMKAQCPSCQSKDTKVSKKKDSFTMVCNSCHSISSIIFNK